MDKTVLACSIKPMPFYLFIRRQPSKRNTRWDSGPQLFSSPLSLTFAGRNVNVLWVDELVLAAPSPASSPMRTWSIKTYPLPYLYLLFGREGKKGGGVGMDKKRK